MELEKYKNIQKLVLVDGAAVIVTYLVVELFFLLYEKVTYLGIIEDCTFQNLAF